MKQIKFVYDITRILIKHSLNLYVEKNVRHIDRNVESSENVPEKGPCIVVFNHPRKYDPSIIIASTNRNFYFVADKSIYKNIFRKIYYNLIGCIKVGNIGSYFKAVKKIRKLLKDGEAVFVFSRGSPEKPLEKSKPTLAKIVFEILEKDKLKVPMIPGNIKYVEENGILHSYINFHELINPESYFEEYKINKKSAIRNLTNAIDEMIE